MFLKKNFKFIRTAKFKIAISFGLLFTFFSVLLFFVIYYSLSAFLVKQIDSDIMTMSRAVCSMLEKYKVELSDSDYIDVAERVVRQEADELGSERAFMMIISSDGVLIAKSDMSMWNDNKEDEKLLIRNVLNEAKNNPIIFECFYSRQIRVCVQRVTGGKEILISAKDMREESNLLSVFRNIFKIVFIVIVILSIITGWIIAMVVISPINKITMAASAVASGNLTTKVPVSSQWEELKALILSFNNMVDQIRSLVNNIKDVSDNIAHDLRTPLTRIRGLLEVTVGGNPTERDYLEMSGEIVEECDRLIGMIETMLDIARNESGLTRLELKKVDINEEIGRVYNLYQPIAHEKNIEIILNSEFTCPIYVDGDRVKLQRLFSNLLDNAIKYTGNPGRINIRLSIRDENILISIKDNGCGINKQDHSRVFERFYRAKTSNAIEGHGLGLCQAMSIVKLHHGSIILESLENIGSEFVIVLPLKINAKK